METRLRSRIMGGGVGLALLATAALLPTAAQAHNPISGGNTSLKVDGGTAKALAANGVSVKALKPAKVKGGSIDFPVTGGEISSDGAKGSIKHSGGLKFKAGGESLSAKSFVIELNKGKLTAKVGPARVPLLKLDTSKAKITRQGLDTELANVKGSLTTAAARALNATFDVRLFKSGIPVGKTTTIVTPETVRMTGGDTALTLDPGTAGALTSLGISAAPIDPASANPDGSLAFPITGGKVNATSFAGKIKHSGGISLSDGVTTVDLTEFDIQIDDAPDLTAAVGPNRISILDLDLSGLEANVSKGGTITLGNVVATLTPGAASALNAAFGTTAFTGGLVLGTTVTNAKTT
jgi:hypothetical protein